MIDGVLGTPETVQCFLAETLARFGGRLRPARKKGLFELHPGELGPKLAPILGESMPVAVTFDRQADPDALYLGRTSPAVAAICGEILGKALAPAPNPRVARAGAMATDAVARRTVLLLLRIRYRLRERVEEFAEEVLVAAFERHDKMLTWLQPFDSAGADLLDRARPTANLPEPEKRAQVAEVLTFLDDEPGWHRPILQHRVERLTASHTRLRTLVGAPALEILPHEPPDILGCFVLMPARRPN